MAVPLFAGFAHMPVRNFVVPRLKTASGLGLGHGLGLGLGPLSAPPPRCIEGCWGTGVVKPPCTPLLLGISWG